MRTLCSLGKADFEAGAACGAEREGWLEGRPCFGSSELGAEVGA